MTFELIVPPMTIGLIFTSSCWHFFNSLNEPPWSLRS